ncbi:hypothetical protein TIFTF001_054519, partial [Ficus carica]
MALRGDGIATTNRWLTIGGRGSGSGRLAHALGWSVRRFWQDAEVRRHDDVGVWRYERRELPWVDLGSTGVPHCPFFTF